ncbi:MAG: hypothetical protein WCX48_09760 [Bacteroidales bacterium]
MKKGKELFHPSLYRLLDNIVNDCPVTKSGTYNRQDPTHFERGEMSFEYKGAKYLFEYYDCTWGIEVTISHTRNKKEIASFYLDWDARKYNEKLERFEKAKSVRPRQDGKGFVVILLARAFPHVLHPFYKSKKELAYEEEMEMWIDPAGGTHYGYEEDPARMYE